LQDNRRRDIGHDAHGEDAGVRQVAAGKRGHQTEELAVAATRLVGHLLGQLVLVHHRQRDAVADAVDDQEQERDEDLPPQLRDREDRDQLPHRTPLGIK
jgi:hypothetical protein